MNNVYYVIVPCVLGNVGIIWYASGVHTPAVVRIVLPSQRIPLQVHIKRLYPHVILKRPRNIKLLSGLLHDAAHGKRVTLSRRLFDCSCFTAFERRVLHATRSIPRGMVATYAWIAHKIHNRRASRAVGNVLAKNPFPLIIPCHRVICSNRKLGGFQMGTNLKRILLKREGVMVTKQGRVIAPI